jgi:hypothetical protein
MKTVYIPIKAEDELPKHGGQYHVILRHSEQDFLDKLDMDGSTNSSAFFVKSKKEWWKKDIKLEPEYWLKEVHLPSDIMKEAEDIAIYTKGGVDYQNGVNYGAQFILNKLK